MVMTMGRRRRRPRCRGGDGVRGRQINWARLQLLTVTTTAELRSTHLLQHRLANVVAIVTVALAVVMVLALQLLHLLGERFESGVGVGLGLLRVVLLHLFFGLVLMLCLLLLLIIMSQ